MTSAAPATTGELRRHNAARVLRTLRDDGPLSRSALARRTGLAKATVGAIVADLETAGAVEEHASDASSRGRPSRPVAVGGSRFVALGVEVNVDYLVLIALDLSGRAVLTTQTPAAELSPTVGLVVSLVVEAVDRLVAEGRTLLGVTIAVPGLIGADNRVTYAPNLDWSDVPLGDELRRALGARTVVRVDNDANCAALAETARGVAVGHDDVLYLTGAIGIGAGIVTGGAIMRGGLGYAGEVGHIRIGDTDTPCACGRRGCWESSVGLRAMLRAVGRPEHHDTDPVQIAERVAAAARSDADVRAGLADVAGSLATGAALLANALSPRMIVLGGYFVPLGERLLPAVREALETDVFAGPGCRAELSTLGLTAAAIGGATQTLADVYDARIPLPG